MKERLNKAFTISENEVDFEVVIQDYMEFTNHSEDEIINGITESLNQSAEVWKKIVRTNSQEEINRFYSETDYLYEILLSFHNHERFNKKGICLDIIDSMNKAKGNKVMEFGGGTGQLCLMMYFNSNKDITYVDLPSKVMKFAKWRFDKYQAQIHTIESRIDGCDLGKNEYDFVVSDAVLEHVINLEGTIKSICDSIKNNGLFYLLFDTTFDENFPMHISAKKDFNKILKDNGLIKIDDHLYIKSNSITVSAKHYIFTIKHKMKRGIKLIIAGIKNPKRAINRVLKK